MRYRKLEKDEPTELGDITAVDYRDTYARSDLRIDQAFELLRFRPLPDEPPTVAPESDEVRVEGVIASLSWGDVTRVTLSLPPRSVPLSLGTGMPGAFVFRRPEPEPKAPLCPFCGATMMIGEVDGAFWANCQNDDCHVAVSGPLRSTRAEAIAAMTPKGGSQ